MSGELYVRVCLLTDLLCLRRLKSSGLAPRQGGDGCKVAKPDAHMLSNKVLDF